MIIQIIGLPGAGKTELAKELAERLNAIHWNADRVRSGLNSDLGFTPKDRVEQARRMAWLCLEINEQGQNVIADFINPTHETRAAFNAVVKADLVIWVDRIEAGRFEDTNKMWEEPDLFDYRVFDGTTVKETADAIITQFELHDWKAPTTLMLGRYQPWHEGHQALLEKAHERTPQVVIGVRTTQGTSEKDPLAFQDVAQRIQTASRSPFIVKMPNITNIVYGRDVGYKIEQVELSADLQAISATQKRKEMGL